MVPAIRQRGSLPTAGQPSFAKLVNERVRVMIRDDRIQTHTWKLPDALLPTLIVGCSTHWTPIQRMLRLPCYSTLNSSPLPQVVPDLNGKETPVSSACVLLAV